MEICNVRGDTTILKKDETVYVEGRKGTDRHNNGLRWKEKKIEKVNRAHSLYETRLINNNFISKISNLTITPRSSVKTWYQTNRVDPIDRNN